MAYLIRLFSIYNILINSTTRYIVTVSGKIRSIPNGRDKRRQTTILKKINSTFKFAKHVSIDHRSSSVASGTWRIWISFKVTMWTYVITLPLEFKLPGNVSSRYLGHGMPKDRESDHQAALMIIVMIILYGSRLRRACVHIAIESCLQSRNKNPLGR